MVYLIEIRQIQSKERRVKSLLNHTSDIVESFFLKLAVFNHMLRFNYSLVIKSECKSTTFLAYTCTHSFFDCFGLQLLLLTELIICFYSQALHNNLSLIKLKLLVLLLVLIQSILISVKKKICSILLIILRFQFFIDYT